MTNAGMTTLGEVAGRVSQLSKNCHDKMIPVDDIRFLSLDTVRIDGELHTLQDQAQKQVSVKLRVPFSYLDRCTDEIQAYNLNHWIKREASKRDELFLRYDGEEVRAVFTDRYKPVDNVQVLERLMELGYGLDSRVQSHLDQQFMSVSFPDLDQTISLNGNGDRGHPGIAISNSEVGLAGLTVAAFFIRLVCSNGMVSKSKISKSRRHVSETLLADMPKLIMNAKEDAHQQGELLRLSAQTKVDDPLLTIGSLGRTLQLAENEREAVEWGFVREQGQTMFHVVNAFTRAPHYPNLPAISKHRLERAGGQVLSMVCPERLAA